MIRILRPARRADLISARVFDDLFLRQLGSAFEIQVAPLLAWCDAILGPPAAADPLDQAAANLAREVEGFDFLCPGYECIGLAPLLLWLRNRVDAKIRLLLIAHAPGIYVLEWVLLRPLLRPGDLIVAPSASARSVIEFLAPELGCFVRVIPHPMEPLPAGPATDAQRIVSLGRIHQGKLLHRQVEAMALLRRSGRTALKLQMAGPCTDHAAAGFHPYARSLMAKIARLGLGDQVELTGPIEGEAAKAAFISGARVLLNLSVTVEESFGKAAVEALGSGVPVVATRWDGLPETVGAAGELAPVRDVGPGLAVDLPAEQLAEAIERTLDQPPSPALCRAQARRFHPERVIPQYRAALAESLDGATGRPHDETVTAPGLLDLTAPLLPFAWEELFQFHVEDCARMRHRWGGHVLGDVSPGEHLRRLTLAATLKPLERFMAGLDYAPWAAPTDSIEPPKHVEGDFIARIASGASRRATASSRQVCLAAARDADRIELLEAGLALLRQEQRASNGLEYLAIEKERMAGHFPRAFELCMARGTKDPGPEWAAYRLRQLAQVCREWGRPALALPPLRRWLCEFPDSPDAGPVWLDRCVNAARAGTDYSAEAREALRAAEQQLGDSPVMAKVRALVDGMAHAE